MADDVLRATAQSAPSARGWLTVVFHGTSRPAPARMAAGVSAPTVGSIVRVEMAGTLPLVTGRLT